MATGGIQVAAATRISAESQLSDAREEVLHNPPCCNFPKLPLGIFKVSTNITPAKTSNTNYQCVLAAASLVFLPDVNDLLRRDGLFHSGARLSITKRSWHGGKAKVSGLNQTFY